MTCDIGKVPECDNPHLGTDKSEFLVVEWTSGLLLRGKFHTSVQRVATAITIQFNAYLPIRQTIT